MRVGTWQAGSITPEESKTEMRGMGSFLISDSELEDLGVGDVQRDEWRFQNA